MAILNFDAYWRDHGAAKGLSGLGKDAKDSAEHVSRLQSAGPKLAGAFTGFAAVEVFSEFIHGATESNRLSRITANTIAQTGGAAHVTADQVDELTKSMSEKNGVDDDTIRGGANMLLTFTSIRNEVGKGNDIFDRAAQSATDMAAAMNNGEVSSDGMKQASIQLGKALQDPVAGMGALKRVGVAFSEQQKAMAKALTEGGFVNALKAMGDTTLTASEFNKVMKAQHDDIDATAAVILGKWSPAMKQQFDYLAEGGHKIEAQKMILDEVNKEFGGTAAAAADPMKRLQIMTEDLGKQVGQALLPSITNFADFMTQTGVPVLSKFLTVLEHIPGPVYAVGAGFIAIAGAFRAGKVVLESYRQVTEATEAALKLLGLRATEAAAGEATEAVAADGAAASTVAAGDAAAVAGAKFGTLAGRLGVVGLAIAAIPFGNWVADQSKAKVATDALADSVAHLADGSKSGAFRNLFDTAGLGPFQVQAKTTSEALDQLAGAADVAFGQGWLSKTERIASFGVASREATGQISDLDGALASIVKDGRISDAASGFAVIAQRLREEGFAQSEVVAMFPQYAAAASAAAKASADAAAKIGDTNSVLNGVQHGGNMASTALEGVAHASDAVTASAHKQHAAQQMTIADAQKLSDSTLTLRGADRDLAASKDALTASIKANGRTLTDNTEKGRANGTALDDVTQKTLASLAAHKAAGEPLRLYAQRVNAATAALEADAYKAGMSTTAAKQYARSVLAVPRQQTTKYNTPGLAAARKGAQGLAADLRHIENRSVKVQVNAAGTVIGFTQGTRKGQAMGGPVAGYSPSPTADNIPTWLTAGEHVWSVAETKGAGGHEGVARLRGMARAGKLAAGGPVMATQTYLQNFPPAGTAIRNIDSRVMAWLNATGAASGPIPAGAGVQRWAPLVRRVLGMEGLAASLIGTVLSQMQTESGGNPRAINLWDINAQHGDPSKGLMQVIGSTFRAFHWPGTSMDIYDPLANIAAALNYARHRYGPNLSALGHGHGYAAGTSSAAPGWAWVGERGPELVKFRGGEQVAPYRARHGAGVTVNLTLSAPNYIGSKNELDTHFARSAQSGTLHNVIRGVVKAVR